MLYLCIEDGSLIPFFSLSQVRINKELAAFTQKNHVSLAPGTFCEIRQEKEVPVQF